MFVVVVVEVSVVVAGYLMRFCSSGCCTFRAPSTTQRSSAALTHSSYYSSATVGPNERRPKPLSADFLSSDQFLVGVVQAFEQH